MTYLSGGAESSFSPFASSSQSPDSSLVRTQILLVFPLELLDVMTDHTTIEIFASEVSIAGRRFHLENSIFDRQN